MSSDIVYTDSSKITDIDPNALRTLTLKWLTDFPQISSISSSHSTTNQADADQETLLFINLRKLTINATEFNLSERFRFTQKFFPKLEELVLLQPEFSSNDENTENTENDDDEFNELEINLPRLKSLYLYKCHGLKRVKLVNCKLLESVKFHVNKELQEIVDYYDEFDYEGSNSNNNNTNNNNNNNSDTQLRLISLDKCTNLQHFGIQKVEHVKTLKIDGCAKLESFANVSFPSLKDCLLQGSSITTFELIAPELRNLRLAESQKLAEMSINEGNYPKLEFLDVSRSAELKLVRAVGKLGGLEKIWLTNCENFKVIDLGGLQIEEEEEVDLELVVDDCINLKQVMLPTDLQSPILKKLSLRNCKLIQLNQSQLTIKDLSKLEYLNYENSTYDTFSFAQQLVLNKYANDVLVCCGLSYLARNSHGKVDMQEFEATMQIVDYVGRLLTEMNEKSTTKDGNEKATQRLVMTVAQVYCETAAEIVLRLNLIAMMIEVTAADSDGERMTVGKALDGLADDDENYQCGPSMRQQAGTLRDKLNDVRNMSFLSPDACHGVHGVHDESSNSVLRHRGGDSSRPNTATTTATLLLREHKRASSVVVSSKALRIMNEPDNNVACPICLQDYSSDGTSDSSKSDSNAWYYCNCGHSICGECSDLYNSGKCYYCCQPTGKLVPRGVVFLFMEEVVRGDYGRWDVLYRELCAIAL